MDLAEIRKKAQQNRIGKERLTYSGPNATPSPAESTEQVRPEVAAPEEFTPAPAPPAEKPVVPAEILPVSVPEVSPPRLVVEEDLDRPALDPLTALLAGRESGGLAEEEVAEGEEPPVEEAFEEYLYFRVGPEYYAVNIMDIKEIIKPREVTEVPRTPDFISGVLSLRGVIIPIFDMTLRLGLMKGQSTGRERIVVTRKGEGFCGILVDEVVEVVKMPLDGFDSPPPVLEGIDRDFVAGIGRHDKRMLILLDLDKVLDINLR